MVNYLAISYSTCVIAIVGFAVYAIVMYTLRLQRQKAAQEGTTAEQFITARRTMSKWRIAWSFFASAVGAWCITSPTSYAYFVGIVGLAFYAFATGLPLIVIALFGDKVRSQHPDVATLPDFVGKRYGPVFKTIVVLVSLFNMSIVMLAEYVTIGSLFQYFVGSVNFPIIITVGLLTIAYTAYGGLYVSIITDQAQGICITIIIAILYIFIAAKFRPAGGFPKSIPEALGANSNGYSAIYSMPCSLMASTVFSEAMWQKVWASESRSAVVFGGVVGGIMTTLAVFLLGFAAWLAAAVGWIGDSTNPNLYMFQMFMAQQGGPTAEQIAAGLPSAQVSNWIGVLVLILAVTMNESAIDSLQNGIAAVVSNHFFKRQHILFTRIVVILVNIPIMIVAIYQELTVLQLFHITNVLTSCCFIPLAVGLSHRLKPYVSETCVVFAVSIAIVTVTAYGIGRQWENFATAKEAIEFGAWWVWYGDVYYLWDIFLVASGFSVVGMVMWAVPAWLLKTFFGIEGPGISGLLQNLPGFKQITGSGLQTDLLLTKPMQPIARMLKYDADVYHSGNAIGSAPSQLEMKLAEAKKAPGHDSASSDSGSDPEAATRQVVVEAK